MFDLHPACADMKIVDAQTGEVICTPRRKRVALVGFGSNTRALAPWTDPTFELWGINQAYQHIPRRADRWFELHKPEYTPDARDPEYLQRLQTLGIPIYMQEPREDIPTSVHFPIDRLLKEFKLDYYTSSVAFMIALAIAEHFEEIHLYGIDLITDEEYASQKPCVEWWLGVAWGRGMSVYIPNESALLKQPFRYGYEQAPKWGAIPPSMIEMDLVSYMKQNARALAEYHTTNGAIQYARRLHDLAEAAARGAVLTMPFLPESTGLPLMPPQGLMNTPGQ